MKSKITLLVLFLVVSSIFASAANLTAEDTVDCGFWCKVSQILFGSGQKDTALAGKAGGIWGTDTLVGKTIESRDSSIGNSIPNTATTSSSTSPAPASAPAATTAKSAAQAKIDNYVTINQQLNDAQKKLNEAKAAYKTSNDQYNNNNELLRKVPSDLNSLSESKLLGLALDLGATVYDSTNKKTITDKKILIQNINARKTEIGKKQNELIGKKATENSIVTTATSDIETYKKQLESSKLTFTDYKAYATDMKVTAQGLSGEANKAKAAYDSAAKVTSGYDKQTDAQKLIKVAKDAGVSDGRITDAGTDITKLKTAIKDKMYNLNKEYTDKQTEAAKAASTAKQAEEDADNIRWSGDWITESVDDPVVSDWLIEGDNVLGYTANTFFSLTNSVSKYRGLSNLIVPDETKKWMDYTNNAGFKYLNPVGEVTKEVCEYDDKMYHQVPGKSSVFIETQSGTYQFVGKIQAEVSANPTYVLCDPINKTCPSNYVCKSSLCYEDEDDQTPVSGYLHKIDWGITAPQDEKQTPYIDENNKSVKFNVMIKYNGKDVWLYERKSSDKTEAIALTNGESDRGLIMRYLGGKATEACVKFSDRSFPVDRYERNPIKEICTTFKDSAPGRVDYGNNPSVSYKVSSGEVSESKVW